MSSSAYHPLVIARAWDTTPRARVAEFRVPDHLRQTFVHRAGQYVTLRVELDGVWQEHAFSLCSSPEAGQPLTIAVKRSDTSRSAPFIQSLLQPGTTILVSPPQGSFTIDLHPESSRCVALFAAGSGITPLLAIATSVLVAEPLSTVELFYANVSAADTMFADELRRLHGEHGERLRVVILLEEGADATLADFAEVRGGRLAATDVMELVERHRSGNQTAEYALCGPPGFLEMVNAALGIIAVPAEHIHIESFSSTPRPTPTP
jgi:ring-1,2-phenylacetyl-CoA epoxidase subunit PaaE